MNPTYRVIDHQGQERGPMSEPEVQALYAQGLLGDGSQVCPMETQRWSTLAAAFPSAAWRRAKVLPPPPMMGAPMSSTPPPAPEPHWAPPTSALDAAAQEKPGPDGIDWWVAGGLFAFFLMVHLVGSKGRDIPTGAEGSGYACGQMIGVLIFPAAYLLLRRWTKRVVSLITCGGCVGVLIVIGFFAAFIPAMQRARKNGSNQGPLTIPITALPPMQRTHLTTWVSLMAPGELTETTLPSPNLMVARSQHFKVSHRTYQVEATTLEMQKGFRVTPKDAAIGQRKFLMKSGVPAEHIGQEKPITVKGGDGYFIDYWTQEPGTPVVTMKAVVLAFPAKSINPTRGLILVLGGTGKEEDVKALMNQTLDTIQYTPQAEELPNFRVH